MSKYNIEHIEKLRIHELRDFARSMGVQSPTTMKKRELISKINNLLVDGRDNDNSFLKISKNNEIDFFSLLTSDNSTVLNDLIAQSIKKDEKKSDTSNTIVVKTKPVLSGDNNVYYPTEEFIGVNLTLKQDSFDYNGNCETQTGYLDIHPEGYGIVRKDGYVPTSRDSYLPKFLIAKHKLRKGHLIVGKVRQILENKPQVMYEILSIDDLKDLKKVKTFDEYDYNNLGSNLYLNDYNLKIQKGSRTYIKSATLEDCIKLGQVIVEENAPRVKIINIKARPEENYKVDEKMELINCAFNKPEIEIVNSVELVVERIKREYEYGIPNVLIIYNFSDLIRSFNAAIEGFYDFNKFNVKATNKINNILYLAKNTTEKLNFSIICVDKQGVPDDVKNLLNSEYLQLFNQIVDTIK